MIRRVMAALAVWLLLLEAGSRPAPGSGSLLVRPVLAQSASAAVTRGPYLQMGTPRSVVVRWRTDTATDSRVIYGLTPGAMTRTASNPAPTTEHEVTLQGLVPATRYYYAIGTSAEILAGGGNGFPLTTSPPDGSAPAIRIWVIGDSGSADSNARAVRDAYASFNQGGRTDLWLMLGDNAYSDGTDSEYQEAVFDMYPEMLRTAVLWPTLGNHDGHTADSTTQSGPYYSIFTLPRNGEAGGLASGTEAYYSFDYGNIHFICLNSYDTDRSPGGAMMTWLEEDISSTSQIWIVAFWHHPPYSKGSHDSDSDSNLGDMRENALPILEQGGVDLVLAGHSHSYERSFLLDGHYGSSSTLTAAMKKDGGDGRTDGSGAYEKISPGPAPHEGAVYVVAGSSGHAEGGGLDHPAMFVSFDTLGSVVLDVNGAQLDAKFLDSGGVVRDYFTLLKGSSEPVPPPARPRELAAEAISSSQIRLTWKDGSDNESGFRIERCAGDGCSDFSRVASARADITIHLDPDLMPSTTYRYRVAAYNAGGDSSYSNEGGVTTLEPPPPGAALFQDDFEDGMEDGWSESRGTWSVVSDGSRVYQQADTAGDAISSAGEAGWVNYTVEARVRPEIFSAADGFVRLVGRFQDADNHVYVLLRSSQTLELKKLQGGSPVTLGAKAFSVSPGIWYTLRLELVGSRLRAYVNGTLELAATDPQSHAGTIAVGTYNASGAFDDIVVRVPEGPPPRDYDKDGMEDGADNCPTIPNVFQQDGDADGIGDACEDPRVNANADDTGSSAGRIDGSDLFRLVRAFGSRIGDAYYDPVVDLSRDLGIDGRDLALLAAVWAEPVPPS